MEQKNVEQMVEEMGVVFSAPEEIPNEKPDEVIEYGTFEELLRAAGLRGGDIDVELEKILKENADVDVPALERDVTDTIICPGHPKLCLGSGDFPGIECYCDNCDHYLECFPEEDLLHKHGIIVDPTDDEEADEEEVDNRWLKVCRVRCKLCGDVLERTYQSRKDDGGGMMTCTCGKVSFDPSPVLWRVNGNPENYEIQNELAGKE